MSNYHLKIIVLAAGKSTRFNGIKVLAPIIKKHPISTPSLAQAQPEHAISMVEHVLTQISSALITLNISSASLHIATGQYHAEITKFIGEKYSLIHCQDANLGMGHTISNAVENMLQQADSVQSDVSNISHVMITLADQIALNTDDYIKLIKQSITTPEQLICAMSAQPSEQLDNNPQGAVISPPAIFPHRYFNDLLKLQGDKGAKALLHVHKDNLKTVLLPNAKIDIDTPVELNKWINS